MAYTVNLGLVKAIHSGVSAPSNIKMIWYDETIHKHKYYNTISSTWDLFGGIVGKKGTIDPAWFDIDSNLVIVHGLGSSDVMVTIRDSNNYINNVMYTWEIIDSNIIKVHTGQIITGNYSVIAN